MRVSTNLKRDRVDIVSDRTDRNDGRLHHHLGPAHHPGDALGRAACGAEAGADNLVRLCGLMRGDDGARG